MNTHVKVVGWLWILNGLLSVFMLTASLVVFNLPEVIPNQQDSLVLTFGALCFFLPGMIAYFVAGSWVLLYKNWARILAIILAILNLPLFPIGTILGVYTLWVLFNDETKALFETES